MLSSLMQEFQQVIAPSASVHPDTQETPLSAVMLTHAPRAPAASTLTAAPLVAEPFVSADRDMRATRLSTAS